jgi:hypothetical protein
MHMCCISWCSFFYAEIKERINMTGATSGAGTDYPSWAPEFTEGISLSCTENITDSVSIHWVLISTKTSQDIHLLLIDWITGLFTRDAYEKTQSKNVWFILHGVKEVWIYQRGNQNGYIEGQMKQLSKQKWQTNNIQYTAHTWTWLKPGGEIKWFGRVSSSCSTCNTLGFFVESCWSSF